MSDQTPEFPCTPERQSDDVIEAACAARDAAREARNVAQGEYDSWGHVLASYALAGAELPAEFAETYKARGLARDEARDALQAARVEWYHSMGKHAHGYLPDLCCGNAAPTGRAD